MSKVRYYYDPKTLAYKKIEKSRKDQLRNMLTFLASSALFAVLFLFVVFNFFDSPKEKQLIRELEQMTIQYELLDERLGQMEVVLDEIQIRDDNIYRVIFEADPIPTTIRKAGYGGVNRYAHLENLRHSSLVVNTSKKADQLAKQLVIQSKSFDEVVQLVKSKEDMLASIPDIQPVANKNLRRMASGFGYRVDPIYKTTKFHAGMDFSAPIGTPIYATGNGVVELTERKRRGYGNNVRINHGYGYVTLYAHLSEISVRRGQRVSRGDIIGYVGNTGKSVGPHLHYEVRKDGKAVNPINFYYNDLSPEEYGILVDMATAPTQSLD